MNVFLILIKTSQSLLLFFFIAFTSFFISLLSTSLLSTSSLSTSSLSTISTKQLNWWV